MSFCDGDVQLLENQIHGTHVLMNLENTASGMSPHRDQARTPAVLSFLPTESGLVSNAGTGRLRDLVAQHGQMRCEDV